MELRTIFGIFSVLGMIFVLVSGASKMLNFNSDHSDKSEASIVSNTLIKVLTLLGIHILAETFIFKKPTPITHVNNVWICSCCGCYHDINCMSVTHHLESNDS